MTNLSDQTPSGANGKRRAIGSETEARVLNAAIRVFAQRGLSLASMREIANVSGVTAAAIYIYFADKEALYEEACRACFDRTTKAILGFIDQSASPTEQLRDFVRGMAMTLLHDPDAARLFEREIIEKDLGDLTAPDRSSSFLSARRANSSLPPKAKRRPMPTLRRSLPSFSG